MLKQLIELLLSEGVTIKASFEISLERKNKVNNRRYPAVCQFCGEEIGDYQYASGASRALAEHLKNCEERPEPENSQSIVHYENNELPTWIKS